MSAQIQAVKPTDVAVSPRHAPPCAVVVFGATGDLTHRKLMPALYKLTAAGFLGEHFAVVGVARREKSDETFRREMGEAVKSHLNNHPPKAASWTTFTGALHYVTGEFGDDQTYRRLQSRLEELDREHGLEGNRLFYLATPPSEFEKILNHLQQAGLIVAPGQSPWTRVIIEKPFGRDLDSARHLNGLVSKVLAESQTFRIDHYLGKETVQNIMVFRFGNSMFEPLWNRKYVDYVEICATETVGIESRGKFYEKTGVLRDIVQNHLLEVLCLVAMEPPTTGEADDIRTEKLKVLHALRKPWAESIEHDLVLGQYRGYREESNVARDSETATYAALRVLIDNWRWQGVPFYLRTGKRLKRRVTEVSFHMQSVPLSLFGRSDVCERIDPNVLTLRIQPDEGIQLYFASKIPGYDLAIGTVAMDMNYTETFGGEPPEAYERLLLDAMRGDQTLFSRRDAVEASWAFITPILDYLDEHPPRGFPNYDPGSWGPESAHELMQRDGRMWRVL